MTEKKKDSAPPEVSQTSKELREQLENGQKARLLLRELETAPKGDIVEVGCARTANLRPSDGWSTIFLTQAAMDQERKFVSWDMDPDSVRICNHVLELKEMPQVAVLGDGVEALASYDGEIAFLHLDGSNDPKEALAQYEAAPLCAGAVVCVDDAQYMGAAAEQGKATLLVKMLTKKGWRLQLIATEPGFSTLVFRQKSAKKSAKAAAPPATI